MNWRQVSRKCEQKTGRWNKQKDTKQGKWNRRKLSRVSE